MQLTAGSSLRALLYLELHEPPVHAVLHHKAAVWPFALMAVCRIPLGSKPADNSLCMQTWPFHLRVLALNASSLGLVWQQQQLCWVCSRSSMASLYYHMVASGYPLLGIVISLDLPTPILPARFLARFVSSRELPHQHGIEIVIVSLTTPAPAPRPA